MSLIGLPETYRFAIYNQVGITISNVPVGLPTVSGRRVRFDTNGVLSYEATSFVFFSATAYSGAGIANNSYQVGSTISNTVSGWLAGEFLLSAFASGNASGNIILYLEVSPDGGTTWPSPASANGAGGGIVQAVIGYASIVNIASTASTSRTQAFEL